MAEDYTTGKRVQAVDELGRWCAARVQEVHEEEWTILFPGYPGFDRMVGVGEIRWPVPPMEEQERRNGYTSGDRRKKLLTKDHLRFMAESQRGDSVVALNGQGVIHTVDPFNRTVELADGSSVILQDIILPVEEKEQSPVKRRRTVTSKRSLCRKDEVLETGDCEDASENMQRTNESDQSSHTTNCIPDWTVFRVGRYQCGKVYEIKGLGLTVMVITFDLAKKAATCHPLLEGRLEVDTTITVPAYKLSEHAMPIKGDLLKKANAVAMEAFNRTSDNLTQPEFRREHRKMLLSNALAVELGAAFRSRTRRKNFDLGLVCMDLDNSILGLQLPRCWTVEYSYKKNDLKTLDNLLGIGWDIHSVEGLYRFVTSLRIRVTNQFMVTGTIKVADFDAQVDSTGDYRTLLKEHMNPL